MIILELEYSSTIVLALVLVLPYRVALISPPVHFWKCTNVCHTKHMAENPIPFVWERPKAPQHGRTSHTKYMRTTPGAGGKRKALYIYCTYRGPSAARIPVGGVRGCIPSGTVGSGCLHHQQGSSVRALPPLNWIHGGAAGDEYMWLFPT